MVRGCMEKVDRHPIGCEEERRRCGVVIELVEQSLLTVGPDGEWGENLLGLALGGDDSVRLRSLNDSFGTAI